MSCWECWHRIVGVLHRTLACTAVFVQKHAARRAWPGVEWLSRLLAQVLGETAGTPGQRVFDASLVRQVKQFQLAQD